MNAPTPEQIAKLPKWAQEHVEDLERRTRNAEKALRDNLDTQTVSPFRVEDYVCIGDGGGKHITRYVQTHKMTVVHDGVHVDILLRLDDPGIEVSWSGEGRMIKEIACIPTSFQKIKLVSREKMRV